MQKKYLYFFLILSAFVFFQTASSVEKQEEYHYLNHLALESGADKSSNYHNYTEIYAQYFASLKEKPIKFLEIGIHQGSSVKLWERYFKNAELHFIDITFSTIKYFSDRSHYHLVNQEDPQALQKFAVETGGNFDIIVDDGGHMMNQQIVSFQNLFPHIKSGGMYIIEDLHTSYWPSYGGGNHPGTTIAFLKGLIDELNFVGAHTMRASHRNLDPSFFNVLNIYRGQVESMHFYDSLIIIKKR